MSDLLEITGDDIALLSDSDLRALIGRLCEEDFRLAGLSTSGIIWGGHQDASDDGMDVTIRSEVEPPGNSLIPRKTTGFQVKKPDMTPARIKKEMKPKGKLREEIKRLIEGRGAYIIANSAGSVTDKALQNRLSAMREMVADVPNHQRLFIDFLDRGRIASWVRTHSSLVLWVRNKIGRPLQGWRPYDNWARTTTGLQEEYIIDETSRLHDGINSEQGISVIDGLNKLRLRLSQNGTSVRLTGLSGVGKTRFVQALFDERLGEQSLSPGLAHYTDMSDNPNPDPMALASQLVATETKAILIIDNCSFELHRTLTKLCTGSKVSLLTVEYDIRDDLPEETDVFRLEPSSDKVIEKLLEQRYPNISQINVQTITGFASGNARVAIALANTLKKGESLSTLRDEDLFDRLFRQRHQPSESLKISAEICSLVYSFNGEDVTSDASELAFLAKLAEKSSRDLYRDVVELRNRGLVQARSVWRAVLPHAIANRLAKNALSKIPTNTVVDAFMSGGSDRLIKSFSRRLGYLHDCKPAIDIAQDWLKPSGWIGEANCNLNEFGLTVLENVAPIVPPMVLTMFEHAADRSDGLKKLQRHEFIRLLRHLAYEADLFQKSVKLLCKLALLEQPNTNDDGSARKTLSTLFHLVLSGTHAPTQMRSAILVELLESRVQEEQDLGIALLSAALETHHFMITQLTTFGARSRDYGYHPKTAKEIVDWYRNYLAISTKAALWNNATSVKVRRTLSDHLRGLWSIGVRFSQEFLDELVHAILQIHSEKSWSDGWISIRGIIRYDGKNMDGTALLKLKQLSDRLKPANLLEQARTYALTDEYLSFDMEDDFENDEDASKQWKRVQATTQQVGEAVGQDLTVFNELLPELVSSYHHRLFIFGMGLADGCEDKAGMWRSFHLQIESTPPEQQQINVMLGFLSSCAVNAPDLYKSILDSLITDEILGRWFPHFQLTSKIDKQAIERLSKVLDEGNVDINSFHRLGGEWNSRHESVNDDDLANIIQKLILKENGIAVACEILNMRFHREKGKLVEPSEQLMLISREILLKIPYEEKQNMHNHPDHRLAEIASVCLSGEDGADVTKRLCQHLLEGFQEHRIYSFHYPRLLGRLARTQPYVFLDTFIGKDKYMFGAMTFNDLGRADSPVNQIPENIILDWCEQDAETRYPLIVASMQTYVKSKGSEVLRWHPIVSTIFEKSPNIQAVLSQLGKEIYPRSWSGSLANAMARRFSLFAQLYEHPNPEVRSWAVEQNQKLESEVQVARVRDLKESREQFERFE